MSESVLGISGAGIQKGNLTSNLSTWNGNIGFLSVDLFISTKENSTHGTQVALGPLSTVCSFMKSFIVQDVLKAFSEAWIQNWHFPWTHKSLFFQYVKMTP